MCEMPGFFASWPPVLTHPLIPILGQRGSLHRAGKLSDGPRIGIIPFGPLFRYNAGEKRLCFELKTSSFYPNDCVNGINGGDPRALAREGRRPLPGSAFRLAPKAPPQIRTRPFRASGSSVYGIGCTRGVNNASR